MVFPPNAGPGAHYRTAGNGYNAETKDEPIHPTTSFLSSLGVVHARPATNSAAVKDSPDFLPTQGRARGQVPNRWTISRELHEGCRSPPGSSGPSGSSTPKHFPPANSLGRGPAAWGKGAWRRGNSGVTSRDARCLRGRAGRAALQPASGRFWPSPPWVPPPGEGGDGARGRQ